MSVINIVAATGGKSAKHRISFLREGRFEAMSLVQLDALAAQLAGKLIAAGFQRGQRIGVIAANTIEWVLLDLAAIKAGVVIAGFEFGKFNSALQLVNTYNLKGIYADIAIDHTSACNVRPLVEDVLKQRTASTEAAATAPLRYAADDYTTIKFTSGSTGVPKGLCASVGSIDSSLASVQEMFHHCETDNILVFLPLSLLQQRYWIYSALAYGHDVTVVPFAFALEAARQIPPTVIMGVPGFFESIKRQAASGAGNSDDLERRREKIESLLGSRIRYLWTGSAPASPDVLHFFNDCGIPLFEGYGMNETCIVSKNHPGAYRVGSVGKVLSNKRITIDEHGVLIVGSDHPVNTSYIYCSPGDNEKMFLPNGDVRTGDLARIDQDGFLYIQGRADDMIALANGRNIHVRAIEERIKQHSGVGECVLFGSGEAYLIAVISPDEPLASGGTIMAHIGSVNATLPPDERVLKVLIAPTPFDSGLLTSQLKPKRKEIFNRYKDKIEKLDVVHTW